jgi:high-affinity nickel-transport protein
VIQSNESESAIDNATRGLLNLGQLPVTCGLFFSLGHSTIVVVVVHNNVFGRRPCAHSCWQTVAIAISSNVYHKFDSVGEVGGIIGRSIITEKPSQVVVLSDAIGAAVSGSFLFIIGLANSIILWKIIKRRREVPHLFKYCASVTLTSISTLE